jgi:small conductance mechanosensitive channel
MQDEIQTLETAMNIVIDFFVKYSFQVIGAIFILIIGVLVARKTASFLLKVFERKNFDPTLSKFIANVAKGAILAIVIIIAVGKFGITIAPFIAALAAMAFGASFAIQGPIANYGAGLVIILTRPFVVGNTIRVASVNGVVEEIKLGTTILTDEDGVKITIPNKHIVGEIIHNSNEWKIIEETVGISYSDDPEVAIDIIDKCLGYFDEISQKPSPQVGIEKFGDSSIDIGFRYWVPTEKYFQILYKVNLEIYKQLKEGNIEIPFPQRTVHLASTAGEALHTDA